jgi:Cd2+/Zn2+-exporting ATPase
MLVVAFDPDRTSEDAVIDRVRKAGYDVEQPTQEQTRTTQFSIPAMDCPSCAKKVSNALERVEGITELDLQPTTGTAAVTYGPDRVAEPTLIDAIEGVGYDITDSTTDESGTSSPTVAAAEDIWTSSRAIKT